jgi:protein-S-isoprenylcysteine O-methyltransferase Ste14
MSAGGFVLSLLVWNAVISATLEPLWRGLIAWGGAGLVLPVAALGRICLDRSRDPQHVARVTAVVHFLIMTVLGSAAIAAIQLAGTISWGRFPFPASLGRVLTWIAGGALLLTVLNLAVRGMGAPFAIKLSGRLATDWCYAYTRNPMVLCLFAFLVALACWLQSGLLLVWAASAVIPVMVFYLRVYEEPELELRFGVSYVEYRKRVPMLWPRRSIHN